MPRPSRQDSARFRVRRAARSAIALLAALGAPLAHADDAAAPPVYSAPTARTGMSGALGAYPFTRESSGTSWQPDNAEHVGAHEMNGDWMLMGHALLNGVYDWQQGPRGDTDTFVSGMFMGSAERTVSGADTLRLRAMLSPDPLMGKSGLPLLLASGETANGTTPLVDRQHPHDLFMELSASYAHPLTDVDGLFIYGGLPGEPAFGPPAFMHRPSTSESPEPPITHHWLDSTHVTFGVVTVGWVHDTWKLEASRFRGREPDQFRYNIETGRLDSDAVRLSWNPTAALALQVSWAHVVSPEQLFPAENQQKESASALYTVPFAAAGSWSTTLAWGRRSSEHGALDAYALESTVRLDADWSVFARLEREQNDELALIDGAPGPVHAVGKASAGVVRYFRVASRARIGAGGLYSLNAVPHGLEPLYGSDPRGAMLFLRLVVD